MSPDITSVRVSISFGLFCFVMTVLFHTVSSENRNNSSETKTQETKEDFWGKLAFFYQVQISKLYKIFFNRFLKLNLFF